MAEILVQQLPSILFALAALVASISTLVSVVRGHVKMDKQNQKLDDISQKVNGGLTAMMESLADIARQSATASKTVVVKRGQRQSDFEES